MDTKVCGFSVPVGNRYVSYGFLSPASAESTIQSVETTILESNGFGRADAMRAGRLSLVAMTSACSFATTRPACDSIKCQRLVILCVQVSLRFRILLS